MKSKLKNAYKKLVGKISFATASKNFFSKISYIKRKRLQSHCPERFFSAKMVCDILNIAKPTDIYLSKLNFDEPLTIISGWFLGVIKGCMFVEFSDKDMWLSDYAMKNGAAVILANRQIRDYPCIIVPDTIAAYSKLCGELKRLRKIPTIAVTGSVGKITTNDMVYEIFRNHYKKVFCTPENANMYPMVGYFIQLIPSECERYIQEVHEGEPDSTRIISEMIGPDISIITNIDNSHLEYFNNENDLKEAVYGITTGMSENGIVIINADCDNLKKAEIYRRVVTVGIDNKADYIAKNISNDKTGINFHIVSQEGEEKVRINILGDHNVYNALLAYAAARTDNIPNSTIISSLAGYKPRGIRQNVVKAGHKNLLYIDCYNASPKSMESAIDNLVDNPTQIKGAKRIAVLGNMEELGDISQDQHRIIGEMISRSPVEILITYGEKAEEIATHAKSNNTKVYHATDFKALICLIKDNVKPGDSVLFKASHSMHLDRCISKVFPLTYLRHIVKDRIKVHINRYRMAFFQ